VCIYIYMYICFCGQRVWNLLKYTEEWRFSMETFEWGESVWMGNRRQNVSGRPVSVATETVKQQIEQRIHDYRRVTIDEIAIQFNTSHSSACNIVHEDLGYRKGCSRWGPKTDVRWCTADDFSGSFGLSCSWRRCLSPSNCDRGRVLGVP